MKRLTKKIIAGVAMGLLGYGLLGQHAQAVPIQGDIEFDGVVTLKNAGSGSTLLDFSNARVDGAANFGQDATGAYSSLVSGTPATFTDFAVNPLTLSFSPSPVTPVWQVALNGVTYSFRLDQVTSASIPSLTGAWSLNGVGYAQIVGSTTTYEETAGTFSIGAGGNNNSQFHFTAGSTVPDGGATLALLGIALTGLETFRRKASFRKGPTA